MHNRILLHLLKNRKTLTCHNLMIMNNEESFVIFPNYMEVMGMGTIIYYVDLSGRTFHLNQKGIFHFKDSNFFFI